MKIVVKTGVPVILIVLSSVLLVLGQNGVLNSDTYPIEYKISLNTTQLNSSDTFDGEVAIRIGVNSRTHDIRLNLNLLDTIIAKLFEIDGIVEEELFISSTLSSTNLRISSTVYLEVDKQYIIKLQYVGYYQSLKRGLYKSGLSDNGQITMIATNLVPQYASWVFPCYDDPTLKANFSLTIQHPVGYNAISNMDVLETKSNDSTLMVNTTFRTTPSLSIHSLAFAVIHINYKSNCIEGDLKICVIYDNQHTLYDVELVQEVTVNALNELKDYFGVTLDLPKLDIFPDDKNYPEYRSGSYGILNNNPMYYYFNLATSGFVLKEEVIRHTIRQVVTLYFGNLLIPQWWDDSWIIQGLSVLFEYIIADKLYPEFDEMNQFLTNLYELGFIDEAIKPNIVRTAEEWYYNKIEYKSAGVLYMLNNFLGEDIFKNGLHTILSNASYHLISSEEFFNIFTQLAIDGEMIPIDYDLNTIMDTWLTQNGYPYVWMIRRYAINTRDGYIQIKQSDASNVFGISHRTTNWSIPYTCVGHLNSTSEWNTNSASNWLEGISETKVDHGFETELDLNSWMLCNNQQSSLYYINYDPNNYRLLANQLYSDHTKIPAIARAQLLQAAFKTVEYEQNSFSLIFQLCNYMHQEDTYTSLNIFIKEFMEFANKMYGTAPYENIIKFIAHKIGPAYDRIRPTVLISIPNSLSFNDEKLRTQIIRMACFSGYNNCLEDMNILLAQMINGKTANEIIISIMDDEFRSYILHYGMVLADENLFWKMVVLSSESNELATALAYVRNSQLIDKLFEILTIQNYDIINGIQINISGLYRALILEHLLTSNLPALDKTIDFMIEKSTLLQKILESQFEGVVISLAESTKNNERLKKLEVLIVNTSLQSSSVKSELAKAQENVKWCNYRIPEFEDTLSVILQSIDDGNGSARISTSRVLLLLIVFGSQLIYTIV